MENEYYEEINKEQDKIKKGKWGSFILFLAIIMCCIITFDAIFAAQELIDFLQKTSSNYSMLVAGGLIYLIFSRLFYVLIKVSGFIFGFTKADEKTTIMINKITKAIAGNLKKKENE